jgi:hypothetical protein
VTDLLNRDFVLNVGGLEIRSRTQEGTTRPTLKVTFRIERSLEKNLNTAEVTIFNLNKESRATLQDADELPTSIQAGYIENISEIFLGDLEYGNTVRVGTDWVTSIQSRDGANKSLNRVSEAFKRIKIGDVLRQLVEKSGLALGNAAEKALAGPQRGNATEFIKGVVVKGLAFDEIDRIARQMGLRFSVQNGEAQFLTPLETLSGKAILLSEGTGMIGSPEPGEKGLVSARSLLQPELIPGLRVQIQAQQINGLFRVEKAIFIGDTWGTDWYTDIEAKPIT